MHVMYGSDSVKHYELIMRISVLVSVVYLRQAASDLREAFLAT